MTFDSDNFLRESMFQDTCFTYLFHIQNDIHSSFAGKEPTHAEHADRM